MVHGNLSLANLPVEILMCIIYDNIRDVATFRALSQTSQKFRELALPLLFSHKATLDFTVSGYREQLRTRNLVDFLAAKNSRKIGLIKQLCINIDSIDGHTLMQFEHYNHYVKDVTELVLKSRNIEMATVAGHTGRDMEEVLEVLNWAKRLVKHPKLKVLFLDACGRNHFRSMPDDQDLARVEKLSGDQVDQKGIQCLSLQVPSNEIYEEDYSPYRDFIRQTLADNICSLNRLWFNGPELQEAIRDLPASCFANMRLKSLSIRYMGEHDTLVKVFGLHARQARYEDGSIAKEDAMTNLEYLYLSDGRYIAEAELEFLNYLYTPKLKSLQVGTCVFHPWGALDQLSESLECYLESMSSLQRFGTTNVENNSKWSYRALLQKVLTSQPRLRTLAAWHGWHGFDFLIHSGVFPSEKYQHLEKLELLCRKSSIEEGIFSALEYLIRSQLGTKSSLTTLSIGQTFWEQQYFAPQEICIIVSTILYIHQKRHDPTTPFTKLCSESQISPLIETPARRKLFDAITKQRCWPKSFMFRSGQRTAIKEYLSALAIVTPPWRCQWNLSSPEWDTHDKSKRKTLINRISEAVMYELYDGFKRLELELKVHRAGAGWPGDVKDWILIWEKTEKGWELIQYTK